ncbi:hypothetical protein AC249_AIPGENE22963, partial [Exaiptasia diaphana]
MSKRTYAEVLSGSGRLWRKAINKELSSKRKNVAERKSEIVIEISSSPEVSPQKCSKEQVIISSGSECGSPSKKRLPSLAYGGCIGELRKPQSPQLHPRGLKHESKGDRPKIPFSLEKGHKNKSNIDLETESETDETSSSDSETSDESGPEENLPPIKKFLHDDPRLPVYEWGLTRNKGMEEIAKLLLLELEDIASISVASGVPTNVNRNTAFVIDTSHLDNIDDLKCDELGSWTATGVKTVTFKKKHNKVLKTNAQPKNNRYKFTRRYFMNDSLKSLKKAITTAEDCKKNVPHRFAFVQYIFAEGEQTVNVLPHGNSRKSNKPYKRTMKSTLEKIKDDVQKCVDPRKVIHNIIKSKGGIEQLRSGGELPRNRKQVYNAVQAATRDNKIPDPLEYLMKKSKEELMDENTAFIRTVQSTPEPLIFLSTKHQLLDIERFCTNPENFCVLGVDATFELCDYYLTFATYRNQMLETKNGKHPALVGPAILHKKKLERSYTVLPAEMCRWHPPCAGVLVVGTDGEENLVNGLRNVFRSAEHLRCDIHMRDNIKSKLSSLGIPQTIAKEYLDDIFGRGNEAGLIHCLSAEEFDGALERLKTAWESRHSKGKDFVAYFVAKKALDIKETMRAEIRSMCGLGYPPDVYTQNASESMNRVLKEEDKDDPTTRRMRKNVCDIVERVRKVVERQENEQFLAVIGRGEYQICDNYKFLEVGDKYFQMNDKQKQEVRRKFFSSSLSKENAGHEQANKNDSVDDHNHLSIVPEKSEIISVPFIVLKEMFNNASKLIKSSSGIVKAPQVQTSTTIANKEELWFVASQANPNRPHQIQ